MIFRKIGEYILYMYDLFIRFSMKLVNDSIQELVVRIKLISMSSNFFLRATYNYFLIECGETYDFHTTGTMPTKVQFSLHNMPPSCKVRIQMYTMRPNSQGYQFF